MSPSVFALLSLVGYCFSLFVVDVQRDLAVYFIAPAHVVVGPFAPRACLPLRSPSCLLLLTESELALYLE